jgi:regulator of cell morphogenesis and NO signaling
MSITKQTIIGELVAKDYRAATIFKKNNIDFCCNGNRTIENACIQKNLDADKMVEELNNLNQQAAQATNDYNSWPLDLLADYIEKKHHRYVETRIPEIMPFLEKVVRVHGENHPELYEVEKLFKESAGELTAHLKKEELILFPYIRKMVEAQQSGASVSSHFGTVQNPIRAMMAEHDTEGERFRQIAALTNDYTPPADACNTFRVTYGLIQEFENDLHLHIHLENNILFPKSILLEEKFKTV